VKQGVITSTHSTEQKKGDKEENDEENKTNFSDTYNMTC